MSMDDPIIVELKERVTAAQQEYDLAIAFHEVWKPSAYDKGLHHRLGVSYATQAFRVVRTALRREMLLALMRLWDENPKAIRMQWIARNLQNPKILDALALDRASRHGFRDDVSMMRDDLAERADEAVRLIRKYMQGGVSNVVFGKLQSLRHERLAHRQVTKASPNGDEATDEEIEGFYRDNSKLIEILLNVVNGIAYEPEDTANIFGFYAAEYWKRFGLLNRTNKQQDVHGG